MSSLLVGLVGYITLISVIGSIAMIIDKNKAQKGQWRIPEKILFILALVGGSLSMFLTMHGIRHKNQKLKFALGLPLIAIMHIWLGVALVLI